MENDKNDSLSDLDKRLESPSVVPAAVGEVQLTDFFRGILEASFPEEFRRLNADGKLDQELHYILHLCQSVIAEYHLEVDANNPYFLYRIIEEIYFHFLES